MTRKRGRPSTSKPIDELQAEIRQACQEWDALQLEERIKAGRRERREPASKDAPTSFFKWREP
jgi:hypothetical protein